MKQYKPMLAQKAPTPFSSKDWIYEIKWDGIRAIAYIDQELSIKSRNQKELEKFFPELKELSNLTTNTVLDGEIIVMNQGKPDFQKTIQRIQATNLRAIQILQKKHPALYVIFDILEKNNKELINKSLMERKKILKNSVKEGNNVIISVFVEDQGEKYYKASQQKGLEGIMAKKKDSKYTPGKRSNNWLKIKKIKECDCVIFGYTNGTGTRKKTFGALILGLYENEKPVYVGKVGTGFTQKTLEKLTEKFQNLKSETKTLQAVDVQNQINWIKPVLVSKIAYQTTTNETKLRMPRFLALRNDKNPKDCTIQQIKKTNLTKYVQKRNFKITPEPKGENKENLPDKIFVIQEHNASHLHYDLRLESNGVLKSWAVPKGVPQEKGIKRLAIQTEDHPIEYANFEGTIPKGEYGAGTVKIWDKGKLTYKNIEENKIEFKLKGKKLNTNYALIRLKNSKKNNWLLIKVGENK